MCAVIVVLLVVPRFCMLHAVAAVSERWVLVRHGKTATLVNLPNGGYLPSARNRSVERELYPFNLLALRVGPATAYSKGDRCNGGDRTR